MNLAKISASGQVTVPAEIRKRLKLKEGDRISFVELENGDVVIDNASASAIIRAQKAFEGAARDFGVENEDDVQLLVDEIRYGKEKRA
jgi:AbrB family looped-hinge helix DNA binding protein